MTPWWTCALVALAVAPLSACTDTIPGAERSTTSAPTDALQPTPTLGRHGAGDVVGADIDPNIASPSQTVVVTPAEEVRPGCGVTMALYDPYLWGDRELIGLVLGTGEWAPFDPNVSTTVLACLPPPITGPVSAPIPDAVAAGLYQACIGAIGGPNGCALLRVLRLGEIARNAAEAAAEPVVVAPGQGFTLTPADPDALVCSRFELAVGWDGGLELVGFPTPDGDVHFDVPGATTTAPRCGSDTGVPPRPVTFVAPDVPDGPYLFCLASRFDPPGCARVTIQR